jgi:HEAT repeat protein
MPGAPSWIRPLAAATLVEGGDRSSARAMLRELQGSEERYVRAAATRGLAQLKALDDLDELARLVEQFHARTGGYPANLAELMRASGVAGLPADPTGQRYVYNPASHEVGLSPSSTLNPLPKTFKSR